MRRKDQKTQEDLQQPQNFEGEDTVQSKKNFNKLNSQARARVEQPFSQIKRKFKSLSLPWQEDPKQQGYLVTFPSAIYSIASAAR